MVIKISVSMIYRPNPCTCTLQSPTRNCGAIQNNEPRALTCTTDASDTACCPSTSYCVYGGFCFKDDGYYDTAEVFDMTCDGDVSKWCPVGFDWDPTIPPSGKCVFKHSWGSNKYLILNSSFDTIARLDDMGFIIIKGTLHERTFYGIGDDERWIFLDRYGNKKVAFDLSNGDMYIAGDLNYSQASITNNPFSNDFVLVNLLDVPQILFNETGSIFTKKFLYQNSNP